MIFKQIIIKSTKEFVNSPLFSRLNPISNRSRLTRYVSDELTDFSIFFHSPSVSGRALGYRYEARITVEIFRGCISAAIMVFPFPECDIQVKGG